MNSKFSYIKKHGQFLRFLVVGLINTGFSYGVYAAGLIFGLSYVIASLVSLLLGIGFSFFTQGNLVFKNAEKKLFFRFVVNWVLIYLCMIGLIGLFVGLGVNQYWAGVLAMPPLAVLSFVAQKYIVFRGGAGLAEFPSVPVLFYFKNYRHFVRRLILRSGYGNVSYGAHSYGVPLLRWWGEGANLKIGKYCSIASGVEIFLGGNHHVDWVSTYPFSAFRLWQSPVALADCRTSRGDVIIGDDVWIGSGVVILSGVTIGCGAVIGSNSVVSKNVPNYAVIAGNPARLMRMRFTADQIDRLMAIAWWNWSVEKVRDNVTKLLSDDIDSFILEHEALS